MDVKRLNDRLHEWLFNQISVVSESYRELRDIELQRDGNLLSLREGGSTYWFGFQKALPSEQMNFMKDKVRRIKSGRKSLLERERAMEKIEMPKYTFVAASPDISLDEEDLLREQIDFAYKGMERKQQRKFRGIFSKPYVIEDVFDFDGSEREVLSVRGCVKELPFGKRKGLSEDLFFYARRGIVSPVSQSVSEIKSPYRHMRDKRKAI